MFSLVWKHLKSLVLGFYEVHICVVLHLSLLVVKCAQILVLPDMSPSIWMGSSITKSCTACRIHFRFCQLLEIRQNAKVCDFLYLLFLHTFKVAKVYIVFVRKSSCWILLEVQLLIKLITTSLVYSDPDKLCCVVLCWLFKLCRPHLARKLQWEMKLSLCTTIFYLHICLEFICVSYACCQVLMFCCFTFWFTNQMSIQVCRAHKVFEKSLSHIWYE